MSLAKQNISKETRQKMSESAKGRIISNETRKKISNAQKDSKLRKSVIQIDKNNNILNVFESMIEAAKSTGVNNSHISRCCLGKLKSAGGFVWRFA